MTLTFYDQYINNVIRSRHSLNPGGDLHERSIWRRMGKFNRYYSGAFHPARNHLECLGLIRQAFGALQKPGTCRAFVCFNRSGHGLGLADGLCADTTAVMTRWLLSD